MNHRPIVSFFRVLSVLALLLFAGLTSAILTMHFAIHGAEVQVPALKGMTVAEARSETAGLGLNLEVDNRYYSGEVAAGHILTQSPEPGALDTTCFSASLSTWWASVRRWKIRSSRAR